MYDIHSRYLIVMSVQILSESDINTFD